MTKNISQNIKAIILGLIFVGGLGYASANWTAPLSAPTICVSGNPGCDAPINVSGKLQQKNGSLGLLGLALIGDLKFLPTLTTTVTSGQVLMADDSDLPNGKVKWGNATGGGGGGFGVWNDRTKDGVADTVSFNTVYKAQTDGMVTAYVNYGSGWPTILGYTDSKSSPTTFIVGEGPDDDGGNPQSLTMPVRKSDYWKVTLSGNPGANGVRWLPMGN